MHNFVQRLTNTKHLEYAAGDINNLMIKLITMLLLPTDVRDAYGVVLTGFMSGY